MRIDTKKATSGDIPAIADVISKTWCDAYKDLLTPADIAKYNKGRDARIAQGISCGSHVYCLELDGTICAACIAAQSTDKRHDGCVEIAALYVLPEYHRRRFGKKLLSHVLCAMRRIGYKNAELCVLSGNAPARAFYEKFGFTQDGDEFVENCYEKPVSIARYIIEL